MAKSVYRFPTVSALHTYLKGGTKGIRVSVMRPGKRTVKGVLKHNSLKNLVKGSSTRNRAAIEKEIGKYGVRRVSLKQANAIARGIAKLPKSR